VKKMPEYMECKIIEMSEERCEYLNDILDENKTLIIHGDGRDIELSAPCPRHFSTSPPPMVVSVATMKAKMSSCW
jgi:hypothetical protein